MAKTLRMLSTTRSQRTHSAPISAACKKSSVNIVPHGCGGIGFFKKVDFARMHRYNRRGTQRLRDCVSGPESFTMRSLHRCATDDKSHHARSEERRVGKECMISLEAARC